MRLPIWRIRALVIATLLFIAGSAAAQGPTREQLIGTWWHPASTELYALMDLFLGESVDIDGDVFVIRFRDDGIVTFSFLGDSYQLDLDYARWELENDGLTITPVRGEDEWGNPPPSESLIFTFEDEALILADDPDSDERYTLSRAARRHPSPPEGNALHGTVTYSDGPHDHIFVKAYKFESYYGRDTFVVHGAAFMLVQGEWDIWGLGDGVWFVEVTVFRDSGDGTYGFVELDSLLSFTIGDTFILEYYGYNPHIVASSTVGGISLEGGRQVVTGIDIVPMPFETTVEATAWGDVKALFR